MSSKMIKVIRLESGGEYTSSGFNEFCREAGIKREFIVPYNPQQNGVTKRKIRIVVEVAKAMIQDHGFFMYLWAEAFSTIVYIQNQSPHKKMKDMTPKEPYIGVKLEVSHLRIFGFPFYIHVPKEKKKKLEPTGRRGTFVDYNESSKAYRIYFQG